MGNKNRLAYRPDIDGLRAIAVISVVAYHCGVTCATGGFVGVDVFFVISGYLIGMLVYKEIQNGNFTIIEFYKRRVKRIVPALFGVLLFTYASALLLLSPIETRDFGRSAFAAITSVSNVLFWLKSGYFNTRSELRPMLMTWSLGVEEQFYVVFPLLMLLLRNARQRTLIAVVSLLALLSFGLCVWITRVSPDAAFFLLPFRAWELASGVLLAILEVNRYTFQTKLSSSVRDALSIMGLVLIVASVIFINNTIPFPGWIAMLPVSGAWMVIAARGRAVTWLLGRQPFVIVGLISYSWYLWHWPLLSFARICSYSGISTSVAVTVAAISLAVAVLSWRFIERPFRGSTRSTGSLFLYYGITAAAMVGFALLLWIQRGVPERVAVAGKMEAAVVSQTHDLCVAGYGVSNPNLSNLCAPVGHGRAIAVIGDSHAGAIAPGLREVAADNGYKLYELTKSECPALLGASPYTVSNPSLDQDCAEFNRRILEYIAAHEEIKIVVIGGHWSGYFKDGPPAGRGFVAVDFNASNLSGANNWKLLHQGLSAEITEIEKMGRRVYLLQDVVSFGFDPRSIVLLRMIQPRRLLARLVAPPPHVLLDGVGQPEEEPEYIEARRIVAAIGEEHPEVHVWDVESKFCTARGCRYADGDVLLFADSTHLTAAGARVALAGMNLP